MSHRGHVGYLEVEGFGYFAEVAELGFFDGIPGGGRGEGGGFIGGDRPDSSFG